MRSRAALVAIVTVALVPIAPADVAACAVCFGASDSPLALGMNAGIFVLLGVTATILTAVALVGRRILAFEARVAASRTGSFAGTAAPVGRPAGESC